MRLISSAVMALLMLPSLALAQVAPKQDVTIASNIQAVKTVKDANGGSKDILVEPTTVIPGTPLVIWVNYKNNAKQAASAFKIDNPINPNIIFTGLGANSKWAIVSVDGGRTYGALTALRVKSGVQTTRAAQPQDVTHIRWQFAKPIPPGTGGTLSFYGVVK